MVPLARVTLRGHPTGSRCSRFGCSPLGCSHLGCSPLDCSHLGCSPQCPRIQQMQMKGSPTTSEPQVPHKPPL